MGVIKKSNIYVTHEGFLLVAGENLSGVNKNAHHTKFSEKKYLPKPLTIGSNPLLKRRIVSLFKNLVDEMDRNYPGIGAAELYKNFKRAFGIKNNKWKIIFEYPVGCGNDIIIYLDSRYNNTVLGKNNNRNFKKIFLQPRNFMYKRESDLLADIGLSTKSSEVKKILAEFFEVSSHIELSLNQHWQFVKYLETVIEA